MHEVSRESLIEAHQARWKTLGVWFGFVTALVLAEVLLFWTVYQGYYWLAVPVTLVVAHLMHSQLLAFHEAAHGVLCPNRFLNELVGTLIGKFHFNGLSLFRAVHHTHHAHLATEKDEQLWPFVYPHVPRWKRYLAAAFELSLGIVYDMVLFWRAFLRKGSPIRNPRVRRRIYWELVLTVSFWTSVVAVTAWFGAWKWLLVLYVIPAVVAGNMHSLRKYVEHMGLTGSSVLSLTRTIVPASPLGRLLAFTMFNISYHGVHHYYAGMPQASLPSFTMLLTPTPEEQPIYATYRGAFWNMLPSLADPRIGPQWNRVQEAPAKSPEQDVCVSPIG